MILLAEPSEATPGSRCDTATALDDNDPGEVSEDQLDRTESRERNPSDTPKPLSWPFFV
jgi:hypothetical protein